MSAAQPCGGGEPHPHVEAVAGPIVGSVSPTPVYGVQVGSRWLRDDGRFQREPVILNDPLGAIALSGIHAASLVPAPLFELAQKNGRAAVACTIVLLEPLPEPKGAP